VSRRAPPQSPGGHWTSYDISLHSARSGDDDHPFIVLPETKFRIVSVCY